MGFDNRKNVSRTADAPSFSAVINEGSNVCTASITWKKGFKVGVPGVTARDMDTLLRELTRLDAGCKFYKRGADEGTLSAKDAATLDALKNDPHTSDAVYRTACASFGVKPEPRSIAAARVASTANLPQGVPALRASAEAWTAFETSHAELFQPPYGLLNLHAIESWFADETVQWTADTLAQCYAELKAANCFRDARTLTRGMNGSLQVVQPYSRERILQLHNHQTIDVAAAPPANLSEVDKAAWQAVHAKYPQLPVGSPAFKKCCADTLLLWCREHVLEQNPELAAANKRGELNKAMDAVLLQWMRNPNLGQGQKTIKDTRIWLG